MPPGPPIPPINVNNGDASKMLDQRSYVISGGGKPGQSFALRGNVPTDIYRNMELYYGCSGILTVGNDISAADAGGLFQGYYMANYHAYGFYIRNIQGLIYKLKTNDGASNFNVSFYKATADASHTTSGGGMPGKTLVYDFVFDYMGSGFLPNTSNADRYYFGHGINELNIWVGYHQILWAEVSANSAVSITGCNFRVVCDARGELDPV